MSGESVMTKIETIIDKLSVVKQQILQLQCEEKVGSTRWINFDTMEDYLTEVLVALGQ